MLNKIIYIFFLIPFVAFSQQQEKLSYEQAIATALKNNFDIQMAKNDAEITTLQNNIGSAGFLPKIDFNASGGLSSNNTKQEFSSGLSVNKNGVASNNVSAGVFLNWTVFDGKKMFATKEKLNLLEEQGQLQLKSQIETTIEEVTHIYFQLVKQKQLIKGINAAMAVSDERIKVAEKKSLIGSGSDVELLQATLDLNAQKSNLLVQQQLLKTYKNNLMVLLKSDLTSTFDVDTIFAFNEIKAIEELKQTVEKSNIDLSIAQKNVLISKQIEKEIYALTMPKVGITSNYLFGRNQNAAGFSLLNQNLGYNLGFTFSWNVFNGFTTKKQLMTTQLQIKNDQLNVEKTKFSLYSAATIAYQIWMSNKEMLSLEEENIKLAERSMLITTERLKLGLGNYIEIKESQNSYEAAITRLVNARYNLKIAETTLKKLTGELVR